MNDLGPDNSVPSLNDPAIVEIALMLVREATDPAYRNGTLIEGLSYSLAMRVIQTISGGCPPAADRIALVPDERIQRVLTYIEEHIADSDLSIEELAAIAFVSPHQLSRLFKSTVGRTPHQFVIAQRISLAKLMMLNSEKSLSEIAYQCGFANQAHFTTRFRDMTGETPNTFKERMTKGKSKPLRG
ncbi:MAG TPA: AraC family transcriptional regulator, partial [Alphaproteobacteria bacterium]|jgi:AraC family transcriptional regulator|nr:AraC family transcriptional regulator [Alphaproteobacteria bacterium]